MNAFEVFGEKNDVEELWTRLVKEPQAKNLTVSKPIAVTESTARTRPASRQLDTVDELARFVIGIPTGMASIAMYEWVRKWLAGAGNGKRIRAEEVVSEPASDPKP